MCVYIYGYKAHLEERYVHMHSHCTIIHNSQEVKVSLIRWMDKENVVYTLDGILYSIEWEKNTVTFYNVDELWEHESYWNKPDTKGQTLYYFMHMKYLK